MIVVYSEQILVNPMGISSIDYFGLPRQLILNRTTSSAAAYLLLSGPQPLSATATSCTASLSLCLFNKLKCTWNMSLRTRLSIQYCHRYSGGRTRKSLKTTVPKYWPWSAGVQSLVALLFQASASVTFYLSISNRSSVCQSYNSIRHGTGTKQITS